jgi:hypothetical protein
MGSPRSDQVRTWLGEAGAWLGEAGDWRDGAGEWRGGGELLNGRRREEGEGRRRQGRE